MSVVIPYYRGADTIERAVRSIERQTVRPAEIVLVDDASPTPLPTLGAEVPIRVVRHDANRGIPAARNTGIGAAAGDWIGFLDQDDEWVPDKLERQMPLARRDAAGALPVVFGRLHHTGGGVRPWTWPAARTARRLEAGGDAAMRALARAGMAAPIVTLLVARETLDRVGRLDETLTGGADDYDLVLRLVAEGVPFRFDGDGPEGHTAVHHFTGANYSAHAPRWLADDLVLIERLAERYPLVARWKAELLAQIHYTFGRHHDRSGSPMRARRHYAEARSLRPAWAKPHLALLRLALPGPARRAIERAWEGLGL